MALATCHTDGCVNNGIPLDVITSFTDPDTGETVTVGGVVCGPCGQPITDIREGTPK